MFERVLDGRVREVVEDGVLKEAKGIQEWEELC